MLFLIKSSLFSLAQVFNYNNFSTYKNAIGIIRYHRADSLKNKFMWINGATLPFAFVISDNPKIITPFNNFSISYNSVLVLGKNKNKTSFGINLGYQHGSYIDVLLKYNIQSFRYNLFISNGFYFNKTFFSLIYNQNFPSFSYINSTNSSIIKNGWNYNNNLLFRGYLSLCAGYTFKQRFDISLNKSIMSIKTIEPNKLSLEYYLINFSGVLNTLNFTFYF
ncbi:MAG: hypothetical protein ACK4IK_02560 [Bacteroidia bacterium]